jgi:hypothetical protein
MGEANAGSIWFNLISLMNRPLANDEPNRLLRLRVSAAGDALSAGDPPAWGHRKTDAREWGPHSPQRRHHRSAQNDAAQSTKGLV